MKLPMRIMAAVLAVILSSCGLAQTATSSLRGTVTDPSGALVVGATVTLESKETGFHQVHKTDKDGSYQFQQVQPATYSVTVANTGFTSETSVVQRLLPQSKSKRVAQRRSTRRMHRWAMPSTSRQFNRFRWRAATCPIC